MEAEIKKFDLLHLNVEIAEPLIDIAHILLLNVFELIRTKVDFSIKDGHLELSSVDLEFAVDRRRGRRDIRHAQNCEDHESRN